MCLLNYYGLFFTFPPLWQAGQELSATYVTVQNKQILPSEIFFREYLYTLVKWEGTLGENEHAIQHFLNKVLTVCKLITRQDGR